MARISMARLVTKRVLFTSLLLLATFMLAIVLMSRRDVARTEQEQYAIYSAYLFRIPLLERPLPVECRENPRFTGGEGVADIRQYFVSDVTVSAFSWPSVLLHVPQERRAARWVPISVFSSFVVRSFYTERLIASGFHSTEAIKPAMVEDARNLRPKEQPTLSATFTKAGFDRDFTMAMFYAEVTCGGKTGREYVFMHKVPPTGSAHQWYWYVVRVDRD